MTEREYIERHLLAGVLALHETVAWIGVEGDPVGHLRHSAGNAARHA